MNVLLVYPYFLEERGRDYDVSPVPIGLYYIGAYLIEHGHQVTILNLYKEKGRLDHLKERLSSLDFDVLGVSLFNGNRFGALDVAKVAKEINPDSKVVFGGVGATFLWHFFLKNFPMVDFVVRGEGERTFLELLNGLEAGGGEDQLGSVKGIAFRRKTGEIRKTPDRPFIEDLDALPDPARYFEFQHVISSRGCPWNCSFCGSPRFWKRRVRFHSPAYFVDQLHRLYEKGISFFYVSDDTFTFKKKRVVEISKKIIERGLDISWYAISRVNTVDEEVLYWMRRAGCIQISYGVESGSDKVRDYFNKGITREQIERAFGLTRRFGILPRAYFIYGTPLDSKKTIKDTIDVIERIKPLSMVSYILDLYPGTKLYEDYRKKSGIDEDFWLNPIEDLMYFETDPKIGREEVLKTGRRIKEAFFKGLPSFVSDIELDPREELRPYHAAFLTRLAMTFTHGDYSKNTLIPGKEEISEKLFKRAISLYPEHDAFLGLGILYQRERQFEASEQVLRQGIRVHPESVDLNICLGITLMNQGRFQEALEECFERFKGIERADYFRGICVKKLQEKV